MKAGINRKRYISITLSVLIVLIVLIIPYMLYFSTFSFLLETKADLGQLGDFIGGITNPLLSFVSILLLIYNIQYFRHLVAALVNYLSRKFDG